MHSIAAPETPIERECPKFPVGSPRRAALALLFYWTFLALAGPAVRSQDFSDPSDIIKYSHSRQPSPGRKSALPEIDGRIQNCTTAKPGWYGVTLDLENGKQIHVIVAPSTKFYQDDHPIEANAAYPQLHQGEKIRALHNPETDEAVRTIIITDLMFETPPAEIDGTIRLASGVKGGAYSLSLTLEKGGEIQTIVDSQTKFWRENKPMESAAAYPQLIAGQKVRILPKSTIAGSPVSDLMFVDR